MSVGVLALQGDVPEHLRALALGANGRPVVAVRSPADLEKVEALFLPGGESTTIARLLHDTHLWEPLRRRIRDGLPVLATCAGLILLARRLEPSATGRDPPTLDVLDVTVRRNDYGSQVDSFEEPIRVDGLGDEPFPGVFIRAPRILAVGPEAVPIAWRGSEVVGVRGGRLWGLTFHPELSDDLRVHRRFLAEVPTAR
ncbi:MAG TPA: pyridoxal 5'-phosphate synthase glutaminase subunit PdxT [Thermoplasmata archaeon]|nr:pyridoxal 5'-phosphate synthase glutaminase subunit PdxT [Thermoplasmata archaeon]